MIFFWTNPIKVSLSYGPLKILVLTKHWGGGGGGGEDVCATCAWGHSV